VKIFQKVLGDYFFETPCISRGYTEVATAAAAATYAARFFARSWIVNGLGMGYRTTDIDS